MEVEKEYPYLVAWKKQGFDKLPTISGKILAGEVEEIIISKAYESSLFLKFMSEGGEQDHKIIREIIREPAMELAAQNAKMKLDAAKDELFRRYVKDCKDIRNGRKPENLNKLIPRRQGGTAIASENLKKVIKYCYNEFIAFQKQMREDNYIPIKGGKWEPKYSTFEYYEHCEQYLLILDKDEFNLLEQSRQTTSYKIILKRINPLLSRKITVDSLRNIMKNV